MNIIFEGDWVKVAGNWGQVIEVLSDDLIRLSRKDQYDQHMITHAESALIEGVLSDLEMQSKLKEIC